MFGNIDRRTAIFPAERQPLQDTKGNHDDRRRNADRFGRWNQPDPGCSNAHESDRNKKGIFPAQFVPEIPEQNRAQRPEAETDGQPGPDQQGLQRCVFGRKKGNPDKAGKRGVDEKIIPLENRAGG